MRIVVPIPSGPMHWKYLWPLSFLCRLGKLYTLCWAYAISVTVQGYLKQIYTDKTHMMDEYKKKNKWNDIAPTNATELTNVSYERKGTSASFFQNFYFWSNNCNYLQQQVWKGPKRVKTSLKASKSSSKNNWEILDKVASCWLRGLSIHVLARY